MLGVGKCQFQNSYKLGVFSGYIDVFRIYDLLLGAILVQLCMRLVSVIYTGQ